jgi:hypothetical protein
MLKQSFTFLFNQTKIKEKTKEILFTLKIAFSVLFSLYK